MGRVAELLGVGYRLRLILRVEKELPHLQEKLSDRDVVLIGEFCGENNGDTISVGRDEHRFFWSVSYQGGRTIHPCATAL